MKRIITEPHMGSGFGIYKFEKGKVLYDFLEWHKNNSRTWGVISIFDKQGNYIRIFDYDLYDDEVYYHYLSCGEYDLPLREIKFNYCLMREDIQIYLGD